jgi:hypothetical protein
MNQKLTIEQLKFAREIGATHVDTSVVWNGRNEFFRKPGHAFLDGEWDPGWAGLILLDDPNQYFKKIDFTQLDDYYADKAVDIAATGGDVLPEASNDPFFNGVPPGYYHDDEEDKLKPMKPIVPANERGTGLKFDIGKPRMSLLPPLAITEMANVMTFGAQKYAAHSWKDVENAQERYLDALLRHAIAYVAGERIDPESGKPTMAHIMCDAAFLIELDRAADELGKNSEHSVGVNK